MTLQQTCPDCGTQIGRPHHTNCDIERCSQCGQQWISCQCQEHDELKSMWTGEWPVQQAKPSFIGVAVLARRDHTRPISTDNCIWRTALSYEEARLGHEVFVGEELRNRFLELERQGVIEIPEKGRMMLDELVSGGSDA